MSSKSGMKGVLWKWTNYFNGWQPRWFILDDGILAYYQSEDEVKQGCKGSVCVAACDINVHHSDTLRLGGEVSRGGRAVTGKNQGLIVFSTADK